MRITPLDEVQRRPRRVAVGEFDGVHLGHREVIRGSDTVLTFDPHPLAVVRPDAAPRLLTATEVKADLVAALGVEEMVVIAFDPSFAAMEPQRFVDQVLVGQLEARQVSVGANFRFGHRAAGDADLLRAQAAFDTRVAPLVEWEGEIVSSSRIRELVGAGEVEAAARLLGAPFQLRGTVEEGDRRGRELGYPTANLAPDEELVRPGLGIYAGRADGRAAAVSVGVRPTFDSARGVLIEAHLLDFEGDLYGRELRLEFLARLREERRFDSPQALAEQMARDVEQAREACRAFATVPRR
jgi:riboflavin kinase/FMN adenylyltransferase